jgi:hypothetical protein
MFVLVELGGERKIKIYRARYCGTEFLWIKARRMRRKILRLAGGYPLLLQSGVLPPSGASVISREPLKRMIYLRRAEDLLKGCAAPARLRSICIVDEQGRFCKEAIGFLKYAGELCAVTKNKAAYSASRDKALLEYGCDIFVKSKADFAAYDVALALDKPELYLRGRVQNVSLSVTLPEPIPLPKGITSFDFACALAADAPRDSEFAEASALAFQGR